ncbi:unnamed protein product [Nippostrongylus brasiliensis]|uniref:EGL-17 (inferred by orthology to a C. elegans protein) n=1 Tax=Nippostrongylus brasiliensis TaxID=27835 RepID=A0A158QXD1_NIPBR|nr:unnamed protein product [Nippostrongylus brasiliensis]
MDTTRCRHEKPTVKPSAFKDDVRACTTVSGPPQRRHSHVFCFSLFLYMVINVNCLTMSGGETRWQLFNQCSKAMLQSYLGHVNARGESSRLCLTDFNVKVNRLGMFQLQHAQSRKFVCFNRRRRITVRVSGLIALTSFYMKKKFPPILISTVIAQYEPLIQGFNSRGRFQDPSSYEEKPKCFSWTKLQRFVSNSEIHRCQRPPKKKTNHTLTFYPEHLLRNMMRSSLLQKIRATEDGPYKLIANSTYS